MKGTYLTATGLLVAIATAAQAMSGGTGPDLSWQSIDGGGGTSSADTITLSGTMGQHDTGTSAGGTFTLVGGFWAMDAEGGACPGDVDDSGDVGFGDILAVLAAWGPCEGTCPADINDDGDVGFGDILAVLAAWGPCV